MKYEQPQMSVLKFDELDVITASLEWDEEASDGTITMPEF